MFFLIFVFMKCKHIFGVLLLTCLLTACAKEEESPLPYVVVDFSIPLPSYPSLMAGMPEKVHQRYDGYNKNGVIIVPNGFEGVSYEVFDATCTHDLATEASSINVDDTGFTATCPRCKTVYNIRTGGYSTDGKSRLQRYKATRSNDRIYVTN